MAIVRTTIPQNKPVENEIEEFTSMTSVSKNPKVIEVQSSDKSNDGKDLQQVISPEEEKDSKSKKANLVQTFSFGSVQQDPEYAR